MEMEKVRKPMFSAAITEIDEIPAGHQQRKDP
jgi:hypothetical protein